MSPPNSAKNYPFLYALGGNDSSWYKRLKLLPVLLSIGEVQRDFCTFDEWYHGERPVVTDLAKVQPPKDVDEFGVPNLFLLLDFNDVRENVVSWVGCHSVLILTSTMAKPIPAYRASILAAWRSYLSYIADVWEQNQEDLMLEMLIRERNDTDFLIPRISSAMTGVGAL